MLGLRHYHFELDTTEHMNGEQKLIENFEARRRLALAKLIGPPFADRLPAEPNRQATILRTFCAVGGVKLGWAQPNDVVAETELGKPVLGELAEVLRLFNSELVDYFALNRVPPITLPIGPTPNYSLVEANELIGEALRSTSDTLADCEGGLWLDWRADKLFELAGECRRLPSWLWLAEAASELQRWRLCHG